MSAPFAALPADRARDTAPYAIAGASPALALRPRSAEEVAAVMCECARRGLAVVPWGGGVGLSHEAAPPPHYDVALDLGGLDRIVQHERDDFTLTAECGVTLMRLEALLAAHGQELPLEAAAPGAATLGGVLAANASGARRLALGAPRDRILGARFVLGDGTLARTGGRVVKNVAGHAVHRLLVGSRGGLGLLLEASLKLLPHPPARVAIVHGVDAAGLANASRWSAFPRREPAVLSVVGRALAAPVPALATGAPFSVVTGFEGDAAWVDASLAFTRERLGEPHAVLRGTEVPPLWRALADAGEAAGPRLTLASAHNTPAALAPVASAPGAERLVFHAPSGRLVVWPEPASAGSLATLLAAHAFTVTEWRGLGWDAPAPPAAVLALRASIASALDPGATLAYGARWRAGR